MRTPVSSAEGQRVLGNRRDARGPAGGRERRGPMIWSGQDFDRLGRRRRGRGACRLSPRPSTGALMALALVTVARMTRAPPQRLQDGRQILRLVVDIAVGAELAWRAPSCPAPRAMAMVLEAQFAPRTARPDGRDRRSPAPPRVAGAPPAVAQRIEGGDAGTQQRCGVRSPLRASGMSGQCLAPGRSCIRHSRRRS